MWVAPLSVTKVAVWASSSALPFLGIHFVGETLQKHRQHGYPTLFGGRVCSQEQPWGWQQGMAATCGQPCGNNHKRAMKCTDASPHQRLVYTTKRGAVDVPSLQTWWWVTSGRRRP